MHAHPTLADTVEAAASGALPLDDAHVVGATLSVRHHGCWTDLRTVRRFGLRRSVTAVTEGVRVDLPRDEARRIRRALPEAIDRVAAARLVASKRTGHVRPTSRPSPTASADIVEIGVMRRGA